MSMSQEQKIEKYMRSHGSITQREAIFLGVYRLGARIWDMRHDGAKIKTENVRVRNVDGTHSYVARYSYEEGEPDGR